MNPSNVVFLGLKGRVTALKKSEGTVIWVTELPGGGMSDSFVTIACDDTRIYAHTKGQLHCLDVISGRILWSNGLTGYGYGVGSICLYGFPPAPDPAAYRVILAAQEAAAASAAATPG